MPLRKHGTPEPMQPDQERTPKKGSANQTFTDEDRAALAEENQPDRQPEE